MEPSEPVIRYDRLIQQALLGVVRQVLTEVAQTGLPGDHHFYITFETGYEGVDIPSFLYQRYPEEMMIVIQHQFFALTVEEDRFSVTLSFNQKRESLHIPFKAVRGFADPAADLALRFEPLVEEVEEVEEEEESEGNVISLADYKKKKD